MTESLPKIAVIEDNEDFREELIFYLQKREFPVWGADSAETFWKLLHRHEVDIVLIDLGLPGEDGFGVIQFLRELKGHGLVIITARGDQQTRLRGLNIGADLFLVKPINFAQLATSLTQLGQRLVDTSAPVQPTTLDTREGWQLSRSGDCLMGPNARKLTLSRQESALLAILLASAHQVFTRQALHDLMFEHAEESDVHRIDVILSRLRQKARQQDIRLPIRTIFGRGIVFAANTSQ